MMGRLRGLRRIGIGSVCFRCMALLPVGTPYSKSKRNRLEEQIARAERDLRSIQTREERAITMFVSGRITEAQLDNQRKFITERLENVRAKLDDYRAWAASGAEKVRLVEAVFAWSSDLGQGLDELTPEQLRWIRETGQVGK